MQFKRKTLYEMYPNLEEQILLEFFDLKQEAYFLGSRLRVLAVHVLDLLNNSEDPSMKVLLKLARERLGDEANLENFRPFLISIINEVRPSWVISVPEELKHPNVRPISNKGEKHE
jgi:hypothetical protein